MARLYFASTEERSEYDALWTEAWEMSAEPAEVAEFAIELLQDAEQAGRTWAVRALEAATFNGLTAMGKKWKKAREPKAIVSHDGAVIGETNSAFSVQQRSEAGEVVFAMKLFTEMSWNDVIAMLETASHQMETANVTRTAAIKLLGLRSAHPESVGPDAAARAEGMTINEYLAAA